MITTDSDSEINDIRNAGHFRCITFSEFKRTDVKRELMENILNVKIEHACYWSAELLCSGHFADLWDCILGFYGKYIHCGNPKIAIYLDMRIQKFKDIVHQYFKTDELRMRNHEGIRKLFAEIVTVLCCAKRKSSFDEIRIRKEDFETENIQERVRAPNFRFCEGGFMQPEDPNELLVAINEFCYHLLNKDSASSFFWIEWLIEYDAICRSRKQTLKCARRTFAPVETKYQMDTVWILWDVLLYKAKEIQETGAVPAAGASIVLIPKIMKSLLNLFSMKYMPGNAKKRKTFLFFGVVLLVDRVAVEEEIIASKDKAIVQNVLSKINRIYKQIKRNEHSPKTDYLYGAAVDKGKTNFDRTITQLETMDAFGEKFIPRS